MSAGTRPIEPKLSPCGCCDGGVHVAGHVNAAGLPEIRYRMGTWADFLDRMEARIHAWEILTCSDCDVRFAGPDRLQRILDHIAKSHPGAPDPAALVIAERPLARLGTRAEDDPAIALMDAWAVVGDVLTFYQERIANESYLRTATERLSVLELARAIGYELDPGVAAETYLAFTVDDSDGAPATADIPAGTQVLSIPARKGELPQTFETAKDRTAHVVRNALRPRMSAPPELSADLDHVFLDGTATGVRAGQVVLLLIGGSPTVKRVTRVDLDTDAGRTRVDFATGTTGPSAALPDHPAGTLDPNQDPLALTRQNVKTHVVRKTWDESDLQAFLSMNDWDAGAVLAYVDDLRAASFTGGTQKLLAFRDTLAFFGHNAPRYTSLPSDMRGSGNAWPYDWDSPALSIWKDSVTDGYYDAPSGEDADVFLERAVPELVGGTWAVFERPGGHFKAYRVKDAGEASRAGFGLSGKVSGLELARPDGSALSNNGTDKPTAFTFRRGTAHVRSEAVDLAPLPLTAQLDAGTTSLRLDTMVLGLEAGQPVILTGVEVGTDGMERSELLLLDSVSHGAGYTTLEFENGLTRSYVRDSVRINANVVEASHGETVAGEVLGSGDGAAMHQRFTLRKPPLTYRSAVGGSESTLVVRVDGVAWTQVDSLYGAESGARVYTVRLDNDANASVIFGDGHSGARLPTGSENVVATYRSGIGLAGDVGAGSLTLLKTRPLGVRSVTNPLAASGGDDPEKLEDARTNAPLTVLTLDRIVSLQDYEDYARAYPGIGKARADTVNTPAGETVHVTVADAGGDAVVEPLYGRLLQSIEDARDPLRPVVLASYQSFVFFVTAKVLIDKAYLWADVKAALESALKDAFGFEARSFGQPVTAAEVLEVMHGVDGVVAVDLDELYRTAPDAAPSGSLFNAVLESNPARFDETQNRVVPAELLRIHPFGIALSEMTP